MRNTFDFSNLYGSVYAQGNVLFTPDGNSLVSPVGNRVTVFDLVNQKCTTLPFENLANITRIALSPDGRVLVTADERGRALLVNFKRGTILAHFSFKKPVASLEFSPDGQFLAASHGSKIQFWRAPALKREFAPFELHRVLGGPTDDVVSIQWHSSSTFIIAACRDNTARIFSVDPVDGWQPVTLAGHKDVLVAAFFGKEPGTVLTVSRDGSLFQWRSEGQHPTAGDVTTSWTLQSRHYFKQSKVASVQFHPHTGVLTVGFASGVFGLYELPSFIAIHTLSFSDHRITTAAVNASGDWLALGSSRMGQLLVWEWQSETYVLKQQGHSYGMSCSAFSPDGALVATGGEDGKVKLWNTTTGFCFVTFGEHEAAVTGLQFLPQGNGVVSCSLDGSVRAHDLVRYKNFRTMTTPQPRTLVSLAVDPSGTVIAAGSQDSFEIYVWQLQTGKLLDVLAGHEGPVCALAFSPTQSILVSGSWDRSVMVWDIFKTKTAVDTLQLGSDVLALCYRPDGKAIAVSTLDGQLQFWDPMNATCIGSITGRRDIAGGRRQTDLTNAAQAASAQRFNSVAFSADGHFVIAGGNSKYICIYDALRMLLYNRVCCSRNQSLDGVMDILSGRNMTEAGARARISHSDALEQGGIEDRLDESLPGVKRGDMTQRSTLPAIRCNCVAVSPTGKAWSCVTTEGLLMYSCEANTDFDPIDLDMHVTPANVAAAMSSGDHMQALLLALRLNERPLLQRVYESVPVERIPVMAANLPRAYVSNMLEVIAAQVAASPHIEFHLRWATEILQNHAAWLQDPSGRQACSCGLRSVQKSLFEAVGELSRLSDSNMHTLRYITSCSALNGSGSGESSTVVDDAAAASGLQSAAVGSAKRARASQ